IPQPAPAPTLSVSDEERSDCRRWLRDRGWDGEPLVVFQTTTRRAGKGVWPRERWVAVVRGVLEAKPEGRAVLTGAPSERDQTAALARAAGDARAWDLAGEMNLRRLFALLLEAHSLLSMDSAPAHAAAALGCPVVVVCGRADPRRNRPVARSSPVEVITAWRDESEWPDDPHAFYAEHEIESIEAEAVLAAWRAMLGKSVAPARLP
ncbi:MAG: glycosyltransferase family 9 protein, partial [Thermoanaerobaculia bacterium]|nr:glycosyltransferase family 9 protein [Thermoanaerobaculia bacterium]